MGNGFEYKLQYMQQIHIPIPTDTNAREVSRIEGLVAAITNAKAEDSNTDTKKLEAEIDQLVYKLYDLTPAEIAIIEAR